MGTPRVTEAPPILGGPGPPAPNLCVFVEFCIGMKFENKNEKIFFWGEKQFIFMIFEPF